MLRDHNSTGHCNERLTLKRQNPISHFCHQTRDRTQDPQDHYTLLQNTKGQYHVQRSPSIIPIMTPTNPIQTAHLILLTDLYIIFQSMWNSTVTMATWLWAGRLGYKSRQEQKNSCPKHPDWLQSISLTTPM